MRSFLGAVADLYVLRMIWNHGHRLEVLTLTIVALVILTIEVAISINKR